MRFLLTNPDQSIYKALIDKYPRRGILLFKLLEGSKSNGIAAGDDPIVVADVVLKAANAKHPKLRYTAGKLASRLSFLRRFAPTALVDSGIRKEMKLDSLNEIASQP